MGQKQYVIRDNNIEIYISPKDFDVEYNNIGGINIKCEWAPKRGVEFHKEFSVCPEM